MAISAATLTTTVSESITLNGTTYGNTITKTHASVKVVRQQAVVVPTSEVTLYNAAGDAAGITFDEDNIKYVRITNTDTSNFIGVVLETTQGDEFQYKVLAGCTLILNAHVLAMEATTAGADVTPGTFSANADIVNITAIADTAAVDVELFIAAT
tara:strand:+ start:7 stop:471 length:465 start_codon:yes stop_codon:yes gene_type:complete